MAKFPTYPTLFDETTKLKISKLKEWNYLKKNQISKGVISWSINGKETASISILVNTNVVRPYIELKYTYRDKPLNYKVFLSAKKSNLGKGKYYYFLCPVTGKQARNLHLSNGYFVHRLAIKNAMYQSQIRSKLLRYFEKNFKDYLQIDKVYEEIYKKHFKKYYANKPTKKHLKLLKRIDKANKTNVIEFINLF